MKKQVAIAGAGIVLLVAILFAVSSLDKTTPQSTTENAAIPLEEPATDKTPATQNEATSRESTNAIPNLLVKNIAWQPDFKTALREAKRTGKPIMVDFFATWCKPCHMLDEMTYKHDAVIKESQRWISVKVDTDVESELSAKYGVTGLPTVAFLTPDGKPAGGFVGFYDGPDCAAMMKKTYAKALKASTI
ncbi:MAG TPA: thioredoxin family protein [Abditibacteriaceae bacterium]